MDWENILKRVITGVIICMIMMFVHKAARASTEVFSGGAWVSVSAGMQAACAADYGDGVSAAEDHEDDQLVYYRCIKSDGDQTGLRTLTKRMVPDAPLCAAGKSVEVTYIAEAKVPTADGKGCPVSPVYERESCFVDTSKVIFCTLKMKQTGEIPPPDDGSPVGDGPTPGAPVAPASPTTPGTDTGGCPAGTTNIGSGADGTPLCAGTGTNPVVPADTAATTPKVSTPNPDGSTNTSESKTTSNEDGSKTTATTNCTVAADGGSSCSTSYSTTSSAAGTPGKKDDPTPSVCDENPQLNMCQNSQVGDGGCAGSVSSISVTGDAIQGAILRKLADERCANLVPSPSKDLGNGLINGSDPMQTQIDAAKAGTEVDIGAQSLDQSGFLGGGACLADRSISVLGHQVPISFSSICSEIQPLRAVILAAAFIVAYLIVSRSVLEG